MQLMPQLLTIRLLFLLPALMFCSPVQVQGKDFSPASSLQTQQIEQKFALFTANWIDRINRNFVSSQDRIQVFFEDARFVARYVAVEKESVFWSVKQVSHSPLAYIGRLEYLEWTFESTALTREKALQGPFVPIRGRKITELFLYNKNRWLE